MTATHSKGNVKRQQIYEDLFQNALSTDPKMEFAMPVPSSQIMFWQRSFHGYVHIYAPVHRRITIFQHRVYELGIGIANSFRLEWRL